MPPERPGSTNAPGDVTQPLHRASEGDGEAVRALYDQV